MDYSLCLLINNKDNKNITKGRRRNFRFLPFCILAYNSYIPYIRSGKDEKVEQLSSHLYLIDDFDLQHNERTGTYVLLGDDITLIETCAAPSLPYILDGLQQLHIDLNEVKNIIVTHVHLDHAGAAGLMMEKCPNATLYVHSRGARHMIDPTKLILGAKAVYKEDFDKLFDPILPIEEERVHIVQHGDTLQIAEDRILTFYDTPGHAKHHISIHDSLTNGIFTGDTIGIYYRELADLGVELYLPSTSLHNSNQMR